MRLTAREIALTVGGRVEGDADRVLTGAEVDSRRLRPGELFVALPGARHDGHEFVHRALSVAGGALVREDATLPALPVGAAYVRVRDPLVAYHKLASCERSRRSWSVIALTGSVGKTTTKEMLRAILARRVHVGASEGNRNSTLGLPAQLLRQPEETEIFVAELGMSRPGELDVLGAITKPDVILYTRIAPVHTEFFAEFGDLIAAKAELLPHLAEGGTLILNADDPNQSAFRAEARGTVVSYGEGCDLVARDVEPLGLAGTRFTLAAGNEATEIVLRVVGAHQVENLVAASAAAWSIGVPLSKIAAAAAEMNAPPRRGAVLRLPAGITVVDDSYNASPLAMESMLELLGATTGRRVAVLGEMLELGEIARRSHGRVGQLAASRADLIICVGGEHASSMADAARRSGVLPDHVAHVADVEAATTRVRELLEPGDIVLVKGSRGIELDRLVDALVDAAGGA